MNCNIYICDMGGEHVYFYIKSLYEFATEIFISNIHDVWFPYVLYDVTKRMFIIGILYTYVNDPSK